MPTQAPARNVGGLRFCPHCGSILLPKGFTEDGKVVLWCQQCGYEEVVDENPLKRVSRVKHSPREKTVEVKAGEVPVGAARLKGKVRCPRCGHDEVYAWMQQTRAADEPPTRFYKCTRCGYTWREYA